jgi:hypothetical protein
MTDFMLLFRRPQFDTSKADPKQMEATTQKWHSWINSIAEQDKLVAVGQRLSTEGKVLKPGGVITDGPFVEIREHLGGYLVIRAGSIEEATTLAHGCPILEETGSVEIRPIL